LLSDAEKATLAEIAHRLGRKALEELSAVAKPDTLLAWYRKLIANKFDGSKFRKSRGRPRVDEETERLVVRMAKENPGWGYDRIVGAGFRRCVFCTMRKAAAAPFRRQSFIYTIYVTGTRSGIFRYTHRLLEGGTHGAKNHRYRRYIKRQLCEGRRKRCYRSCEDRTWHEVGSGI
jgi:hypothetical protein